MTCTTGSQEDYREAFEEFTKAANRVQSLAARNIGGAAFENALLELEHAHFAYNQARDEFLRCLLPDSSIPDQAEADLSRDIPGIAQLIWESQGRPEGTAAEDWRRAETIVRRALAAAAAQ